MNTGLCDGRSSTSVSGRGLRGSFFGGGLMCWGGGQICDGGVWFGLGLALSL